MAEEKYSENDVKKYSENNVKKYSETMWPVKAPACYIQSRKMIRVLING